MYYFTKQMKKNCYYLYKLEINAFQCKFCVCLRLRLFMWKAAIKLNYGTEKQKLHNVKWDVCKWQVAQGSIVLF